MTVAGAAPVLPLSVGRGEPPDGRGQDLPSTPAAIVEKIAPTQRAHRACPLEAGTFAPQRYRSAPSQRHETWIVADMDPSSPSARALIGISGWRYPPWRGKFYPPGLAHRRELEFASKAVRSIELNGSFYSLQRPSSYEGWYRETPDDFVFAVKGGRFITHNKKLRDCGPPLANFFASGVLALEEKLGPILWQLPPQLAFDAERLAAFFDLLPRTTGEAATLASKHDDRLRRPPHLDVRVDRPLRHALEVRHPSFVDPRFIALLRSHRIALCVADAAGKWPYLEDVTADFVYVRLHGHEELYVSGYRGAELDRWAARVAAWRDGGAPADAVLAGPKPRARAEPRDVFVYFDNDVKVRAPYDAMNLAARLGQGPRVPFPRRAQGVTEVDRWATPPARALRPKRIPSSSG